MYSCLCIVSKICMTMHPGDVMLGDAMNVSVVLFLLVVVSWVIVVSWVMVVMLSLIHI